MSDINELQARFDQAMKKLDAIGAQAKLAERGRDAVAWQEKRAAEARRGKLGADWQTVQRRIDREETTLADVFSGADTTPAATRLRELSRRNLAALKESWQKDAESAGTGKGAMQNPAAAVEQARADSQQHYADLAKHVADRLRRG
jgi:hypothetical protein